MSDNKVTYGLEQVHIAFIGVSQTETIEITKECTTDGEITVAVTSAAVTGSPVSVVVPLATETHNTKTNVAAAIVNALNLNAAISAAFVASYSGAVITLTAKVAAANDATLAIAITVGSTGVTAGASANGVAGTTGYGTPQAILGAVRFTPTAEGSESKFYADNSAYFVATANNGYTAEMEFALVPDAILAEMLGWRVDTDGGLVEIADATPKKFALLGQVEGDALNRRFVYYECQASRPAKEEKTKGESIEPNTDVLNVTIFTPTVGGEKVPRYVLPYSAANATKYNAWFTAVQTPAAA